jgi:poly(3-hydroxybutyrate) depolymerase
MKDFAAKKSVFLKPRGGGRSSVGIEPLRRPPMNRLPLLTLLVLAAVLATSARAATVVASDFIDYSYTNSDGTMPARLFVPKNYNAATKYPLVLFLHGVGENGTDNSKQLNQRANGAFVFAEQAANPAFMLAPQNWNSASGWGSDVLRNQILEMIQKAQGQYNIDKDRIYCVGLSNGGAGTWDQLNVRPWLYAAGVPCCGWGGSNDMMKDIPIWAFHAADDGTVPVANTDNAVASVRNRGGNVIYTRYATGGHGGGWSNAFKTQVMIDWLFAQRRGVRDWTNNPNLKITSQGGGKAYSTTSSTITLSGTATDMLPADGSSTGITSVNWTNDHGGTTDSGTCTGTTSWNTGAITLANGSNRIRIIATGTSFASSVGGNTTFTDVMYVNKTTAADTTNPTVTITSPSADPFSTTASIVTINVSASDSGGLLTDLFWSSDRGYNGSAGTSFPVPILDGINVITVTAVDAAGNTATDTVSIVKGNVNLPPSVDAGKDSVVILPATASLDATVTDDGKSPGNATPTVTWSKVSGPGTVTFGNASAVDTTASFSTGGVYVLKLTASDGVLSSSDTVTVVAGVERIQFDFGDPSTTTTGNWNNVTATTTGTKVTGAKNSAGAATSVNLAINAAFTGINPNGTTSAGLYPVTAQQDTIYVQDAVVGKIGLSGLNAAASYHFIFYASRMTAGNRGTVYTIGSSNVGFDPTDNVTGTAAITNITPAGGNAEIAIATDDGSGYGYIGVLDLVRFNTPGADTTKPGISITSPTSGTTYNTASATIALGGTASDNVGVTQVTWSNNRGGSGTASGTTSWSVASIALMSGSNVLTVTAKDAAGNTQTDTLTVTYTPPVPGNKDPVISSGPTATPNPATVNSAVAFSVAATDADGDTLTYNWDLGDGSPSASGASISYTYAAAGVYTASVGVSDGKGGVIHASVSVTVQDNGGGGGGGGGGGTPGDLDSDGDGVSDVDEIAAGTDPFDPNSKPMLPLIVTQLQGSMKFGVDGKDSCRISGIISGLPVEFGAEGKVAVLDAGGASASFTLDAKARAKTEQGTFAMKLKLLRDKATKTRYFPGGDVAFKAKLAKGTWSDDWADEGADPLADAKNAPMTMLVKLTLDGTLYGVTLENLYSAKAGKTGKFKKMK